jgi:hypothetical protein
MSQRVATAIIDFQRFSRSGGSSARHETRHGFVATRLAALVKTVRWSVGSDELKLQCPAAVNTKPEQADEWMWNRDRDR